MSKIQWTDLICSHMYVTVTCSLYGEEKKAGHMIWSKRTEDLAEKYD